jgi:hypothetical protein
MVLVDSKEVLVLLVQVVHKDVQGQLVQLEQLEQMVIKDLLAQPVLLVQVV